jgi:hypothetical protein
MNRKSEWRKVSVPLGRKRKSEWFKEKVISERNLKCYTIRKVLVTPPVIQGKPFPMEYAVTHLGEYIGEVKFARALAARGIAPMLARRNDRVCSIGFCARQQKWYGWSHRAMVGFGLYDRVFDARFGTDTTPFVKHGHKIITTLVEAKAAAKAFARYVS